MKYYIINYLEKEPNYYLWDKWIKKRRVFFKQIEYINFKIKLQRSQNYKDIRTEILEGN